MIKTYSGRKLGVRSAHRMMMLRQLAASLVHSEKITTTEARARELKRYAERMISRLKTLQGVRLWREISRWLAPNGLDSGRKLFEVVVPRYAERTGGYLRIILLPPRKSDQARLARVELIT